MCCNTRRYMFFGARMSAYSTDVCHPVHGKVATQSTGSLPPTPHDSCHPVHVKAATWTTGRLPPTPGEACHHRSVATLGHLLLFCSRSSCQPRLPFPHGFAL